MDRDELARRIAEYISEHGLDFSGKFADIELVLELAEKFIRRDGT